MVGNNLPASSLVTNRTRWPFLLISWTCQVHFPEIASEFRSEFASGFSNSTFCRVRTTIRLDQDQINHLKTHEHKAVSFLLPDVLKLLQSCVDQVCWLVELAFPWFHFENSFRTHKSCFTAHASLIFSRIVIALSWGSTAIVRNRNQILAKHDFYLFNFRIVFRLSPCAVFSWSEIDSNFHSILHPFEHRDLDWSKLLDNNYKINKLKGKLGPKLDTKTWDTVIEVFLKMITH